MVTTGEGVSQPLFFRIAQSQYKHIQELGLFTSQIYLKHLTNLHPRSFSWVTNPVKSVKVKQKDGIVETKFLRPKNLDRTMIF